MSAAEALKAARGAGVHLEIDGDDLVLEAASAPPAAVLDPLSRHKAGVVALLRPGDDGWSAEDWQAFFDERAGIAEFDGGLPRAEAEARAFACCVAEWLNRNPCARRPGAASPAVAAMMRTMRCCPTASNRPAMPGCIRAAGPPGTQGGRPRLSPPWQRWGSRRRPSFQTISEKTEAHDGRLRIGTAERLGRDTVEACRSIDVNRLHREGCLRAGWVGGWQWTRDGEKVASINLRAEADRLHLTYRVRVGGGEWEDVAETVRIVRVACRFGGARPYFICPGVVNGIACGRRVAKLHGPGRYFLCRHCYRLAHASQSEDEMDRTLRRANKIRQRLGGDPGMAAPFPPKPKGMWRRTYERLRERAFEAEMRADEAFAHRAERLLARIDNPKRKRRSFWR